MTRQVQLAIYGPEDGRFNLRFTLMPKERTSARLRLKASRAGVRLRAYHRQRSLPLGQTLALPPGPMDIRVCTWGEWVRTFGFHVMDKQVTLKPGELCELSLGLPPPRAESGWQSATPVAIDPAEPILLRGFDQGGTPGVGAAQDPGGGMCTYQPERYYPHLMLGKGGRLIACVAFFGDIWVSHSDDEGRTWSPMRRLPCPVNSAHAEASPSLILDDRGRYCLAFLSDRNILRRFWPYACFSDDLTHWSRPSKVSEVESQSVHLMQDSAGRYLLTQGTSRGVLVTSSDNCRTWGKPLVAWAYQRAKTNTGLTGGVARAALAQWPDGAYQLLMIHLQPTRTYLSKTAYSLRAIPRLRTGRSRDLSSWTDWHLLQLPRKTPKPRTDYREPAFPSFCMAPGVGLLLSRSAGGPRWFRSEAGRHWHVCTDAKPSAYDRGHGICVTPGGRLVSLHADTNWWERLPWFSAFVADSLPRWLEGRTWKPLPREDPTQEWRIVEFEESANDERQ